MDLVSPFRRLRRRRRLAGSHGRLHRLRWRGSLWRRVRRRRWLRRRRWMGSHWQLRWQRRSHLRLRRRPCYSKRPKWSEPFRPVILYLAPVLAPLCAQDAQVDVLRTRVPARFAILPASVIHAPVLAIVMAQRFRGQRGKHGGRRRRRRGRRRLFNCEGSKKHGLEPKWLRIVEPWPGPGGPRPASLSSLQISRVPPGGPGLLLGLAHGEK